MSLEAFMYERGRLQVLNQLVLPHQHVYVNVTNVEDGWKAINSMMVRGAPAIGICGILSLAVELDRKQFSSVNELIQFVNQQLDFLVSARPTAVNMQTVAVEVKQLMDSYVHKNAPEKDDAVQKMFANDLKERIIQYAAHIYQHDIKINRAIGEHGANHIAATILAAFDSPTPPGDSAEPKKLRVLTHCNTGSLATGGYGTALGLVRSLAKRQQLEHCYYGETRPYNQGARLTAYELVFEKLPSTLICDSAAGALMARGQVDLVVVGADRVVVNGDTANKIGTYNLAVLAKHHNIPFFVAVPFSSCDFSMEHGSCIEIEQRPDHEITQCRECGKRLVHNDVKCWNPAFDVTPGYLVTGGYITEYGVFQQRQLERELLRCKLAYDNAETSLEELFNSDQFLLDQNKSGLKSYHVNGNNGTACNGHNDMDCDDDDEGGLCMTAQQRKMSNGHVVAGGISSRHESELCLSMQSATVHERNGAV